MKRITLGISITLIAIFTMLAASPTHASGKPKVWTYKVSITNLTRGQIISPPIVISHGRNFTLFNLGSVASPGIATVAEDADTSVLVGELEATSSVFEFNQAGGVILPGSTATVEITTRRGFQRISVAGMLVTTNDAFFAVRGAYARYWGASTVFARAYDSGSEVNSENCDYIPGPPCGNGGVRDADDAEGYVFVHSGIHGIGDLDAAESDWNNPVAKVVIKRVK